MANENKVEYSKKISEKFNISTDLQPSVIHFGSQFQNETIDLRKDESLPLVEDFVKKFKDQKLFTPKNASKGI